MRRTIAGIACLLLLAITPGAAASTAPPPSDDAHDKFALALALQKQCGGLALWEEILLSNRVRDSWHGSRIARAMPSPMLRTEAIARDRLVYAARATALGCERGVAVRREVHDAMAVDTFSLLWLASQLGKQPAGSPSSRFLTALEADLTSTLQAQFSSEYQSQSALFDQAVDSNIKQPMAKDPSGSETINAINLLFSALVLQSAAEKGTIEVRLPEDSETETTFRAVERASGKVWRSPGLPNASGDGGRRDRERPYGLLLLGPDGNLAHVLIDLAAPQPLPKSFAAPMRGQYAKEEEYAHAAAATAGCPWQACYHFSKADTDRLLASGVSWIGAYLTKADGQNESSVNGSVNDLNALRALP